MDSSSRPPSLPQPDVVMSDPNSSDHRCFVCDARFPSSEKLQHHLKMAFAYIYDDHLILQDDPNISGIPEHSRFMVSQLRRIFSPVAIAAAAKLRPGAQWAELTSQPVVFEGDRKAQEALELQTKPFFNFGSSRLPARFVIGTTSLRSRGQDSDGFSLLRPVQNSIIPRLHTGQHAVLPSPEIVARLELQAEKKVLLNPQPLFPISISVG